MASWLFNYPWQNYRLSGGSAPTRQTTTLNTSTSKYFYLFQAEEDATITHCAFLQTGLTGSPGTLRIGIRGLDANGAPNTTWEGYGDKTTYAAGDNGKFVWTAITNNNAGGSISSINITRGSFYCVAVECQATGSWDASNSLTIGRIWNNISGSGPGFPAGRTSAGSVQEGWPIYMIRSSTKAYGYNLAVANQVTGWDNGDTPDEIALSFKLPEQTGTFTVVGIEGAFGAQNNGVSLSLKLFSVTTAYSSITQLQGAVFDMDVSRILNDQWVTMMFDESTLTSLNYDQEYIVSVEVTSSNSSSGAYRTFDVDDSYKSAIAPGTLKYLTRSNAGTFAETTGVIPAMNILIATTSGGSGGGGLLVHPGMTGRISG